MRKTTRHVIRCTACDAVVFELVLDHEDSYSIRGFTKCTTCDAIITIAVTLDPKRKEAAYATEEPARVS